MLGIREYARAHNASFDAVTEEDVEAWLAGGGAAGGHSGVPPILREPSMLEQEPAAVEEDGARLASVSTARRQLQAQPMAGMAGNLLRPEEEAEQAFTPRRGRHQHPESRANRHHSDSDQPTYSLFAFPAYDNFAGVRARA